MKRLFYIAAFTVLGILLATLVHAALEMPALYIITSDFEHYQHSFVWEHWRIIHGWGGKLLWLLGALGGFIAGCKFWQILYVEKRYGTRRW